MHLNYVQHSEISKLTAAMTTMTVEWSSASTTPIDLPIELWLAIIRHITDTSTMVQMMHVNRAFCREIEPLLYREVHIGSHHGAGLFLRALSGSSGHHYVQLVNALTVMSDDAELEPFAHRTSRSLDGPPDAQEGNYMEILQTQFPKLRRFVTDISGRPLFKFLLKHSDTLEGLRVPNIYVAPATRSKLRFGCLRSLSCPQPVLTNMEAPSLTHLHLPSLESIPKLLSEPASPFGARLMSLRIGVSTLLIRRGGDTRSGSLDGVVARFPRLRYLQIDMPFTAVPTFSGLPQMQNLWARGPKSNPADVARTGARRTPGSPLAIGWVFLDPIRGIHPGNSAVDVATWLKYLNKAALDVLVEWRDLVDRIVYRHAMIQPVSVMLDETGSALIRKEDREMCEDYWELVPPRQGR
ncbi:hypothetical protein OH76DRAFT_660631 [Lentinus brumalis]|uniref:F-box domain-containing protein n=1 Tax=Lentinus brumalis TaxID=2498619 RepID=A0A371D7K9_9APHY|nr:hypothetical protein OH76DRAFT_660631 [Polyporus brumalis]